MYICTQDLIEAARKSFDKYSERVYKKIRTFIDFLEIPERRKEMTHLKVVALLVGAVAFPVIVWLVMYFDAGQSAKVAFGGAIVATAIFVLIGLFMGTLKPMLAAANPLMGLMLAGEKTSIVFMGAFCFLVFLCEVGSIPCIFPKMNYWKSAMLCFGALWTAAGTFSFLAKGAVVPGLVIFCIGAVSVFGFEYVSRRFKCFQDV